MNADKLDRSVVSCLQNMTWGCVRIATFLKTTPDVVHAIAKAHSINVSERP